MSHVEQSDNMCDMTLAKSSRGQMWIKDHHVSSIAYAEDMQKIPLVTSPGHMVYNLFSIL